MPKGRVYKTKSKGAQEAHESIRPTSFRRDPDSLAGSLKPDELRLYRLIWQRALASQMAPKELETTTIELADGAYELRASATKVLFDGFARVYTEGRDDDATDDDEETGRLPALAEGDRTTVEDVTPTQHFTEPPPRFTEATLIKALEEHGIGRPSTYAATISTITDRGYVRVEERRLHPGARGRDRDRPPGRALRRLRGRRVHRPDGGGARRDRPRRARVGAAPARVLRATARPRGREAARAQAQRLHHRGDRRGLLGGPPDGHPARPQRPLPRLLALPGAQGDAGRCPATSRRPRRGPARSAPSAARGRWSARTAGSGRSSAARATPTATTSRRTVRRRPIRSRSRSSAPRTRTAISSRVARAGPGTSSGGARTTRAATSRPTTSRSAACTTRTTARWRARTTPPSA